MDRSDFQELAEIRAEEAQSLLAREQYDGAYYLAGYAVECALKACIAKRTRQFEFPDKNLARKVFTHDLGVLFQLASLESELETATKSNPELGNNWNTTKDWSEEARYDRHARQKAENLMTAVLDRESGILPWLRERW